MSSPFDNPKFQPAVLVVLDAGNANIKAVVYTTDGNGHKRHAVDIPHGYMRLTESEWESAKIGNQSLGRNRKGKSHVFALESEKLIPVSVGKQAWQNRKNSPLLGSNKYVVGGIDALLCAVLLEVLGENSHNNIIVSCGMPPTEYANADRVQQILKGSHTLILPSEKKVTFKVRGVMSWDEGIAGIIKAIHQHSKGRDVNGRFLRNPFENNRRYLALDAGGFYGNMFEFEIGDDGLPNINYDTIQSVDGGAIEIRNSVRRHLKVHPSTQEHFYENRLSDLDDALIDEMIVNREITLSGDKLINVSTVIDESLDYLQAVRTAYKFFNNGKFSAGIVLVGGTVQPLYNYIVDELNHKNVMVATNLDNIYRANVEGAEIITLDRMEQDGILPQALYGAGV